MKLEERECWGVSVCLCVSVQNYSVRDSLKVRIGKAATQKNWEEQIRPVRLLSWVLFGAIEFFKVWWPYATLVYFSVFL